MRFQVVMLAKNGLDAVEYVDAPNKAEAEYRAAYAAEQKGIAIQAVKAVRKAA